MAEPVEKLDWEGVSSSNVQAVAFHKPSETIAVRFLTGGVYGYTKANQKLQLTPEEVYTDLAHAISVGEYLNNVVKANFMYTRYEDENELLASLNLSG